jgi:hypothetical protein
VATDSVTKPCPKCHQIKPAEDFARNKRKKDGRSSNCKACCAAWFREYKKTAKGRATHSRSVANWLRSPTGRATNKLYRQTEKAKATRNKRERRQRWAKYGLTEETYDLMVAEQGGKCKLCGRVPRRLVIDHCHETGAFRGIICDRCNVSIGKLGDTARSLSRVVDYLCRSGKSG